MGNHSQAVAFQGGGTGDTRQASAEEEGEKHAVIFALLQDQHKLQLEAMAMANKATMDAMMEHMNAILRGSGSKRSERDKENTPPSTNANKGGNYKAKRVKRKKNLCPHYNLFIFHKPNRCYKLDANKDKWWVGWKSVEEAST